MNFVDHVHHVTDLGAPGIAGAGDRLVELLVGDGGENGVPVGVGQLEVSPDAAAAVCRGDVVVASMLRPRSTSVWLPLPYAPVRCQIRHARFVNGAGRAALPPVLVLR